VKQDGAGGRYVISGPKGGNGHDDWYVGEATIRPNGREGYDLISDDGGVTWKSMLTITSDTPQQVSKTILLKKSATGAITSAATETLNVYSTPLALESLSPANGTAAYDPSDATLTLRFSQPVEKGRGYFTIYDTDGAEFAQLNVHALRVRISLDGKTVTLRLPDSFAPNTAYYVTAGAGTLYSQWGYRFAGLKKGDWQFETAPSSDTVRITDLILAVEGESAERKAVYTGKPDADYTAAVVPRADGTEELTVSPKVSGVVSEETVSLTLKAVVMEDPAASSVGKVSINGTHVFIGTGVRSVTLQVDAHGQVESDSATIRLVCTGWGAAVIDNETGFDVQTSNLLEAIVPDDYTIADNEIAIVRLHITELGEAKVDPSERALLLGADDGVIGHYLSIELSVDIFEKNDPSVKLRGEFISVTQNPVVISVLFGDDAPEFVNERMLRLHDGEVDILRAIEKDGAYVFASDLFSTYASAYDILRNITVEQPEHGTLGTDKTQAIKGETVTVTAVAEGGYALSEIRVNGTAITGGTFTMPDEDVRVSAVFTKQQENGNGEQGIGGPGQTGKAAKTGDTAMPLWIWIVIAVIAAAAVVALLRRNRRS